MLSSLSKKQKRGYRFALFVLLLFMILTSSLYFLQESLIFRPTVLSEDFVFKFENDFDEVYIDTPDQARLHGLYFKANEAEGVVLYFHGNMGDLSRWGNVADDFADLRQDIFILDYRTYGKSKGKLSDKALYSDAQLAYDYLRKEFSENQITVYGRSLGTGFATYLAAENSPKQLLLESPYYSMLDMAQIRFPIFPVKYLLKYKIPTNEFIQNVSCPIYIIHGDQDAVVPFSQGEKIFGAASKVNSDFTKVEGGGHNDLVNFPEYRNWLEDIFKLQ